MVKVEVMVEVVLKAGVFIDTEECVWDDREDREGERSEDGVDRGRNMSSFTAALASCVETEGDCSTRMPRPSDRESGEGSRGSLSGKEIPEVVLLW